LDKPDENHTLSVEILSNNKVLTNSQVKFTIMEPSEEQLKFAGAIKQLNAQYSGE
jgi:hypothetical protein